MDGARTKHVLAQKSDEPIGLWLHYSPQSLAKKPDKKPKISQN